MVLLCRRYTRKEKKTDDRETTSGFFVMAQAGDVVAQTVDVVAQTVVLAEYGLEIVIRNIAIAVITVRAPDWILPQVYPKY